MDKLGGERNREEEPVKEDDATTSTTSIYDLLLSELYPLHTCANFFWFLTIVYQIKVFVGNLDL